MFFAALFTAANVALWIAWSGEWIQDILTGVAFGYFLCSLTARIKQAEGFPPWKRRFLGVSCLALITVQTAIFFVPKKMKQPIDLFCYCLLFAVAAFLLICAFRSLGKARRSSSAVLETFAAYAWAEVTLYMSSGRIYYAALLLATLCFPMMLLALKKEGVAE